MENSSNSKNEFPDWAYILSGSAILTAMIPGILLNGAIVFVFIKNKKFHTSTNIYMMFLNVCNFIMAAVASPMVVISSFAHDWLFGNEGCQFNGFVVSLVSYTQIALVVVIAADRYFVIFNSSPGQQKNAKCNPLIIFSGCVIHGFIWALAPVLGFSSYQLEDMHIACSINWNSKALLGVTYSFALIFIMWIVPVVVISFCYVRIYIKIKNSSMPGVSGTREPREKAILKRSIIIIGTFLLTWTPYAIVSAWIAFAHPDTMPVALTTIPALSLKLYNLYSPFIYLYSNKIFRKTFISYFKLSRNNNTQWIQCRTVETQTSTESGLDNIATDNRVRKFNGRNSPPHIKGTKETILHAKENGVIYELMSQKTRNYTTVTDL